MRETGRAGRAEPEEHPWSSSWRPTPPTSDVAAVVARVEGAGGEAFVSRGVTRTIVGLVGDIEQFRRRSNLRGAARRRRVVRISAPYKLVSREHHPRRRTVHRSARRADRPGHVHPDRRAVRGRDAGADAARPRRWPRPPGATLLRGGAYKPRTSPYAFQGLGETGLRILADVREETGLPVVTEVVDAHDVDLVASYADMLQVGTRNMQNFALLQAVGSAGKPVMLKRGMTRHHRGVADGRGVHRPARQPRHRAVRARHPDLRDRRPATRSTSRAVPVVARAVAPAGDRRPVALRRPPRPGRAAVARRRSRSAPTASSSTCTRIPRRRCATARRRSSTATCARWPRPSASCRRCSGRRPAAAARPPRSRLTHNQAVVELVETASTRWSSPSRPAHATGGRDFVEAPETPAPPWWSGSGSVPGPRGRPPAPVGGDHGRRCVLSTQLVRRALP